MNILVLGGSGLFGRKTVMHLLQDEDVSRVVSMDVVLPKEWAMKQIEQYTDKFNFIRGDVSQLDDILNAIRLFSIDRLVNWAFLLPGEAELNPLTSTKINALGMCNSFEAARITGITRVVYASSGGVYGPQDEYGDRPVTEDDPLHPGSAYALMKQYSEMLADQYNKLYGINFSGLRPVVGCGHQGWPKGPGFIKAYSDMLSLVAIGKPFSIELDGTNEASLAPADDVAELTRLLLRLPSSPHPAYNVGGPAVTLRDIAKAAYKYIPDAKIEFGSQSMKMRGLVTNVSMERAKEDTGFLMMSLDESVLVHLNDARLEAGLEPIGP